MRPSIRACLGALVVALALVSCADEEQSGTPGATATLSTLALTPSATAPSTPPPMPGPGSPTPEPTFASLPPRNNPTPRTPEPRTPTPERPPSPVHPPGTRTGLPEVDPVLEAIESRDLDAIMAVVELTEVSCGVSEYTWTIEPRCWEAPSDARFSGFYWANFEGQYVDDFEQRIERCCPAGSASTRW